MRPEGALAWEPPVLLEPVEPVEPDEPVDIEPVEPADPVVDCGSSSPPHAARNAAESTAPLVSRSVLRLLKRWSLNLVQ